MAKTIRSFDFATRKTTKYPWDKWTDGRIWQIQRGVDFERPAVSFVANIHQLARTRKLSVRVSQSGDTITFQFSTP